MLKLTPSDPVWVDLEGARIQLAPITRKAWRAAQQAGAAVLIDAGEDRTADDIEDAGEAMGACLLSRAIIAWEGVVGPDDQPLPVTPETVAMLLADPRYFERLDEIYVMPFVLREKEKNAFAGSPSGISTQATPASDIARSPVRRTAKGGAAPPAPTRSKPRKPKPVMRSGPRSKSVTAS